MCASTRIATLRRHSAMLGQHPTMATQGKAVCVLTERIVMPAHRARALELLQALRGRLLDAPGFQMGALWREVERPDRVVTMDHWAEVSFWHGFRMSDDHARLLDALEVLLAEPSSVRLLKDFSYRTAAQSVAS